MKNKITFALKSISKVFTIMVFFLSILCAESMHSYAAGISESGKQNNTILDPEKPLFNPRFEYQVDKSDFFIEGYVNGSRKRYSRGIKYRDSGYAYDAFIASLAFRYGYNQKRKWHNHKGLNRKLSLYYLNKAADLGLPEANFVLYRCYQGKAYLSNMHNSYYYGHKHRQVTRIRDLGCLDHADNYENHWMWGPKGTNKKYWKKKESKRGISKRDADLIIKPDYKKARYYLEKAAELGKKFDANFQPASDSIEDKDRLSFQINLMITQYKAESLQHLANLKLTEKNKRTIGSTRDNNRFLYQEGYESCESIYDNLLIKAPVDERRICNASDGKECPGRGYIPLRNHLEACMSLAPTNHEWEYYFNERLMFQHVYLDRSHSLLKRALAHYQLLDDVKKTAWVKGLIAKANIDERNNTLRWQDSWKSTSEAYRAKRKREKEEKARKEAEGHASWRRFKERQAQSDTRSSRESAKFWENIGRSIGALDDIDRMHKKAVNDIYDNIHRSRKSRGSGSLPILSTTTNPDGKTIIPAGREEVHGIWVPEKERKRREWEAEMMERRGSCPGCPKTGISK